jgi:nucleoid DNA-binding protein
MTKTELIKTVATATGLSQVKAEDAINATIDAIVNADSLTIVGFGRFIWKTRAARKGRNPRTGLEMDIPATTSLHFKAAPALSRL